MTDTKKHLDEVARALHPHWVEGTRNAYIPSQLPDMVRELQRKLAQARRERSMPRLECGCREGRTCRDHVR